MEPNSLSMPIPPGTQDSIDRREALRRVALVLGGALSAPAIAGVLAGCERRSGDGWTPLALSREQGELVATIAEHIIPETDTPGARATGVHRFIDVMLVEYYPAPERERFLAGLADVDTRARRDHGKKFLQCATADQRTLLAELDRESFATPEAARRDMPWFRTMKELTLLGYYTSEIGATKELRHLSVPGRFEGCVPLARAGRTWAV